MPVNEEDIATLTAMGFSADLAREALTVSSGNMEAAVNYILGGGAGAGAGVAPTAVVAAEPPPGAAAVSAKADGGLLRCSRSQYSVDQGRSACTCIALTAATKFLQDTNVTSEFLEEMITQGVSNYQQLMHQSASEIEHLSAEEVLQKDSSKTIFPLQSLPGGIRQGILSKDDFNHPMGLKAMLEGLKSDQPRQSWMAVLITKTPETVLVCFPPDSARPSSYWLIDSHPRPQLGVESAYAKLHPSLDALWMSLQAIFPCTDLGPGVREMMAMMYNSFDLYPLLLSS